jgi:integrase
MDNERDPYLRLIWLLIAQYGLRPSHVSRLRWGNIRLDSEGNQTEIVADGHTEGFKTAAPVAAALTKQVVDALLEWKAIYPGEVGSEKLILPRRLANGQYRGPKTLNTAHDPRRSKNPLEMTTGELLGHWMRLQKKWGLPKLRPHELRHWVASVCRKTDLSKPASAYLMGHDSASGGAMRDWYDNPAVIEALDEQRMRLPEGTLGYLDPNLVLVDEVPPSALALVKDYFAKRVGTLELVNRLEDIRLKTVEQREVLSP